MAIAIAKPKETNDHLGSDLLFGEAISAIPAFAPRQYERR
jgi:hypothetical protein